ncbi:hypothetical protein PR048_028095 [Dryococelus australis]|uniref:Uncharacterized protein n=1 Tax=Dryococelus australis TaxID=614101 RepID=A0ABQ9GIA6_9NEOP|nr:hypothetical protein PR048_028095 [Dryococelus australis]
MVLYSDFNGNVATPVFVTDKGGGSYPDTEPRLVPPQNTLQAFLGPRPMYFVPRQPVFSEMQLGGFWGEERATLHQVLEGVSCTLPTKTKTPLHPFARAHPDREAIPKLESPSFPRLLSAARCGLIQESLPPSSATPPSLLPGKMASKDEKPHDEVPRRIQAGCESRHLPLEGSRRTLSAKRPRCLDAAVSDTERWRKGTALPFATDSTSPGGPQRTRPLRAGTAEVGVEPEPRRDSQPVALLSHNWLTEHQAPRRPWCEVPTKKSFTGPSFHPGSSYSLCRQPLTVKRGEQEQGGRNGRFRENPPTSRIVRHDSRLRKSGSDTAGYQTVAPLQREPGFVSGASVLRERPGGVGGELEGLLKGGVTRADIVQMCCHLSRATEPVRQVGCRRVEGEGGRRASRDQRPLRGHAALPQAGSGHRQHGIPEAWTRPCPARTTAYSSRVADWPLGRREGSSDIELAVEDGTAIREPRTDSSAMNVWLVAYLPTQCCFRVVYTWTKRQIKYESSKKSLLVVTQYDSLPLEIFSFPRHLRERLPLRKEMKVTSALVGEINVRSLAEKNFGHAGGAYPTSSPRWGKGRARFLRNARYVVGNPRRPGKSEPEKTARACLLPARGLPAGGLLKGQTSPLWEQPRSFHTRPLGWLAAGRVRRLCTPVKQAGEIPYRLFTVNVSEQALALLPPAHAYVEKQTSVAESRKGRAKSEEIKQARERIHYCVDGMRPKPKGGKGNTRREFLSREGDPATPFPESQPLVPAARTRTHETTLQRSDLRSGQGLFYSGWEETRDYLRLREKFTSRSEVPVVALLTREALQVVYVVTCPHYHLKGGYDLGAGGASVQRLPSHFPEPLPKLYFQYTPPPRADKGGSAVAERLARPPPTEVNRVQSPAGSHPGLGIVPDDAAGRRVFSGVSRFLRSFTPAPPIGSQYLAVRSRPNLFNHSGKQSLTKSRELHQRDNAPHSCALDLLHEVTGLRITMAFLREKDAETTTPAPCNEIAPEDLRDEPYDAFQVSFICISNDMEMIPSLILDAEVNELHEMSLQLRISVCGTTHPPGFGPLECRASTAAFSPLSHTQRLGYDRTRIIHLLTRTPSHSVLKFSSPVVRPGHYQVSTVCPGLCQSDNAQCIDQPYGGGIALRSDCLLPTTWGRGGAAVSLLASDQGESDSIPGGVTPVILDAGIVPGDAAGRRVFSRISHFSRPLHSVTAPYSPRFTLIGSQDLDVKGRPNPFIHPLTHSSPTTLSGNELPTYVIRKFLQWWTRWGIAKRAMARSHLALQLCITWGTLLAHLDTRHDVSLHAYLNVTVPIDCRYDLAMGIGHLERRFGDASAGSTGILASFFTFILKTTQSGLSVAFLQDPFSNRLQKDTVIVKPKEYC